MNEPVAGPGPPAGPFPKQGTLFTFYSFKGGVGRSMCLANVAALLAGNGHKVLIVDWDLEAPGIENYFRNPPSRVEGSEPRPGLLELMRSMAEGLPLNWRSCLLDAFPFGTNRKLSILPAGRQDADYPARVQALNWEKLFLKNRLGEALERLRDEWLEEYDFVFVDSRTGFTDAGNICTIHLPDVLVLLFTTNEQSLRGVIDVARRARIVRNQLPYDRRKLMVVPVPSRDESQNEHVKALEWRARFADELREFYDEWVPQGQSAENILEKLRLPYKAFWSFGEHLPVAERGVEDYLDVGYAYSILAKFIQSGINWGAVFAPERSEGSQQENLARLIRAGDAVIKDLSAKEEKSARSLLLRLVFVARPEEGIPDSRRWVPESELGPGEAAILPKLIKAAVVQRDSAEPKLQLADAKLAAEWPLLGRWIAENRPHLLLRQDLRRRQGRLLDAKELKQVRHMTAAGLELGPEEQPLVTRSVRRRRVLTAVRVAALAACLMIATALGFYYYQWYLTGLSAAYSSAARAMGEEAGMAPYAALLRFKAVATTSLEVNSWGQLGDDMVSLGQRVSVPDSVTWTNQPTMGFQIEPKRSSTDGPTTWIQVVDSQTKQLAFQIAHGAPIDSASLSSDGKYIRTVGGGSTLIWRGPLFDQTLSLSHASAVWGLDFSKDGKFLAVATVGVRIWNVEDGKEVLRLPTGIEWVRSVAFSPDGNRLATAGWVRALTIWDAKTGNKLGAWPVVSPQLTVAWSPDGQILASGGYDGAVRMYRVADPSNVTLIKNPDPQGGNLSAINTVVFSADGNALIGAGLDGHLRVWDSKSGNLKTDTDVKMGVTSMTENRRDYSAIAGWSGLMLEDGPLEGFKRTSRLPLPALIDLAFSGAEVPNELAGATNGGFPVLLQGVYGSTFNNYLPPPYPPTGARSVAFSPDGKLATGGNDRVVRVWRNQQIVFTDPCVAVPRNLNQDEWKHYLPGYRYRKLCLDLR